MTEAERKLLVWCAVLHLRTTALTAIEADEIDALIEEVRGPSLLASEFAADKLNPSHQP